MRYVSTRGKSPEVSFKEVLLRGLAPDGGLYLPTSWPQFNVKELRKVLGDNFSYQALASEIIYPFTKDSLDRGLGDPQAKSYWKKAEREKNADDIRRVQKQY